MQKLGRETPENVSKDKKGFQIKNEKLLDLLERTLQLFLMRITRFHARDYHQNLIGKFTTEVKFVEQKSDLVQKGFLL